MKVAALNFWHAASIWYRVGIASLVAILCVFLYKWYQGRKYNIGLAERRKAKRSRECALSKELRAYRPVLGTPTHQLIKGAHQKPLLGFTDSLGLEICVYYWPATKKTGTKPKAGIVMMAHGLDINAESEWCHRPGHHWDGSWIKGFCDAGFDVYGWDHPSMGRSESVCTSNLRSQCFDYMDYVDVCIQLRHLISARYQSGDSESVPIFLQGQSMGGLVSVLAAQRHPELFAGLSVNCPAMYLEKIKKKSINKILLPLLNILEFFTPHLRLGKKQPHPHAGIVKEAESIGQPMFSHGKNMPVQYCGEAIRSADVSMVEENILKLKALPTFWAHSEGDPFVDFNGTRIATNILREAKADVTLFKDFAGGEHDIVQAKEGPQVLKTVVAWMLDRI